MPNNLYFWFLKVFKFWIELSLMHIHITHESLKQNTKNVSFRVSSNDRRSFTYFIIPDTILYQEKKNFISRKEQFISRKEQLYRCFYLHSSFFEAKSFLLNPFNIFSFPFLRWSWVCSMDAWNGTGKNCIKLKITKQNIYFSKLKLI